ncbi:MAG: chorismate mutase [Flavobacteriaceae bacterium]
MDNKKEMRTWLDKFNLSHPLVIAGPCSAETENQVLKIAHDLKDTDVTVFRAGIWKPRTRPGMFEGVGSIGLEWLRKVKQETGLLIATEVANSNHVKLALDYDIDVLWVGARSTVSPFIVQEIAEALEGTDKIVLIKNPVNPDLSLWIGGVERLYTSNIKKLGFIHRGFSTYDKSKYRNNPEWQIPIEIQNKFPDIPLICDPSHICGRRDTIQDVSQTALDLNFDGLMVETHWDPDNAWSDANQQIKPGVLIKMMADLKMRTLTNDEIDFKNQLNTLRTQIDVIDNSLLETLGKRMKVAVSIGKLKKKKNVAVLQTKRWNEILGKMILQGEKKGLSEEFILRIYKAIHQESINNQKKL